MAQNLTANQAEESQKELAIEKHKPQESSGGLNTSSVIRLQKSLITCTVSGFTFSFIHRIEGKWSGQIFRMSVMSDGVKSVEPNVASTKVSYNQDYGYWTFRETSAAADGVSIVLYFTLTPVGQGRMCVQLDNARSSTPSFFLNCNITYTEAQHGCQITAVHNQSGQLMLTQLITLSSSECLERTIITYSGGEQDSVAVVKEQRVL